MKMPTDDLKCLASKLLDLRSPRSGARFVTSKEYRKYTAHYPVLLRAEVDQIFKELHLIIPDEFMYGLFFHDLGVTVCIGFQDGFVDSEAFRFQFTSRESMMRGIGAINWDEKRQEMSSVGAEMESLVSDAEDLPVNIPSSKEAAKKYLFELAEIFDRVEGFPAPVPFILVHTNEGSGTVDISGPHASRAEVIRRIGAVMPYGFEILSVIENGLVCSFETIEAMKLEAVQLLGPIDRAKAERRFMLS